MVFMALDHTRDFICNIPFEPENIDKTWGFHFLVRLENVRSRHACATLRLGFLRSPTLISDSNAAIWSNTNSDRFATRTE